jgi:hypothetical protein
MDSGLRPKSGRFSSEPTQLSRVSLRATVTLAVCAHWMSLRERGIGPAKVMDVSSESREPMSVIASSVSSSSSASSASKHPVLSLPLSQVMKPQIALTLQHVLQLYTVGSFLSAWRNPKNHKSIEQVFDTPQQARHAAAVCATWLGIQSNVSHAVAGAWWVGDDRQGVGA